MMTWHNRLRCIAVSFQPARFPVRITGGRVPFTFARVETFRSARRVRYNHGSLQAAERSRAMARGVDRRRLLGGAAGIGALAAVGDLSFLGGLPPVSADEARVGPKAVRLRPEIEPLV